MLKGSKKKFEITGIGDSGCRLYICLSDTGLVTVLIDFKDNTWAFLKKNQIWSEKYSRVMLYRFNVVKSILIN